MSPLSLFGNGIIVLNVAAAPEAAPDRAIEEDDHTEELSDLDTTIQSLEAENQLLIQQLQENCETIKFCKARKETLTKSKN